MIPIETVEERRERHLREQRQRADQAAASVWTAARLARLRADAFAAYQQAIAEQRAAAQKHEEKRAAQRAAARAAANEKRVACAKQAREALISKVVAARKSGRTLQSIGDEFGRGREAIRQICAKAERLEARRAKRRRTVVVEYERTWTPQDQYREFMAAV